MRRKRKGPADAAMTMTQHLSELRRRLVISLLAFVVIAAIAFAAFDLILGFLRAPLCALPPDRLGPQGCDLFFTGAMGGFQVRIKVATMAGMIFSSPVWLYQIWAFIVPGLHDTERRYALPFMGSAISLFVVGIVLAYLTLPTGLKVLVGLGGENLVPLFRAEEYLNFVGLMLIAFGALFELPLLLFFLGLAGVITTQQMREHRKTALVGICALTAVATPTQDPFTFVVLAVPLYGLYELTILLLGRRKTRRDIPESV
ncbi:MAG: twin-arginine translocase subunit TatC [Actinomycetota bacterium]|nr:twin-arginine translocase subunit TatC [Actinomycetota bacterium]